MQQQELQVSEAPITVQPIVKEPELPKKPIAKPGDLIIWRRSPGNKVSESLGIVIESGYTHVSALILWIPHAKKNWFYEVLHHEEYVKNNPHRNFNDGCFTFAVNFGEMTEHLRDLQKLMEGVHTEFRRQRGEIAHLKDRLDKLEPLQKSFEKMQNTVWEIKRTLKEDGKTIKEDSKNQTAAS